MDAKRLALADNWMGEGMELARRILALANQLRFDELPYVIDDDAYTERARIAGDLEQIISKEWNPCEQPR
jgi:hypothetical protein